MIDGQEFRRKHCIFTSLFNKEHKNVQAFHTCFKWKKEIQFTTLIFSTPIIF